MTEALADTFDLDDALLDETASGDAAPNKRRGRPRGAKNRVADAVGSTVRKVRKGSPAWVRAQCASLVGMGNMLVAISPYSADALDDREMDMLTDALAAECAASERIMRWLQAAAGISPHILLIQAVIAISVPRLQRHGVLPSGAEGSPPHGASAPGYGTLTYEHTGQSAPQAENGSSPYPPKTPLPVDARPASVFDGRYG